MVPAIVIYQRGVGTTCDIDAQSDLKEAVDNMTNVAEDWRDALIFAGCDGENEKTQLLTQCLIGLMYSSNQDPRLYGITYGDIALYLECSAATITRWFHEAQKAGVVRRNADASIELALAPYSPVPMRSR
jgi:hypothetical protein